MAVTLKQIAEIAGVSRGTVDRAIHNRYGVDEEVKKRINYIIEELGYRPNVIAKALKSTEKAIKIGMVIPSCENIFYIDIHTGADEAAKAYEHYGVQLIKKEMTEPSAEKQLQCIDDLLQEGVNGILLAGFDSPAVCDKVNAIADDIPVMTYNTDLSNSRRICFVGQDHIAAGRVAGNLMSKVLSGSGRVATLISQPDMLAHMQRVEGFVSALHDHYPDMSLIGPLECYEQELLAYELVENLVKTTTDLSGIFVAGGGQQGAGQALADSGKSMEIAMICCDLLPKTVDLIQAGVVDFTIGQEPFLQGFMPVKLMYEYCVLGIRPQWEHIFTHIDIRLQGNVDLKGPEIFYGAMRNDLTKQG